MESYKAIVNCVVNHYRDHDAIKFSSLTCFVKTTGRAVFERELTITELDQAMRLVVAELFR